MEIIGLRSDEVVGTYNGTWDGCYERGYRPARHLLPAIGSDVYFRYTSPKGKRDISILVTQTYICYTNFVKRWQEFVVYVRLYEH